MNEMPGIDLVLVDSMENPGGSGEPGTAVVVPAVTGALLAGPRVRVRIRPLTPENIAASKEA